MKTYQHFIRVHGRAPVESTVGYTLLDIVDQRIQTGSLIITSQFPTEHWHSMFNDATLAEAILDRIVHLKNLVQVCFDHHLKERRLPPKSRSRVLGECLNVSLCRDNVHNQVTSIEVCVHV